MDWFLPGRKSQCPRRRRSSIVDLYLFVRNELKAICRQDDKDWLPKITLFEKSKRGGYNLSRSPPPLLLCDTPGSESQYIYNQSRTRGVAEQFGFGRRRYITFSIKFHLLYLISSWRSRAPWIVDTIMLLPQPGRRPVTDPAAWQYEYLSHAGAHIPPDPDLTAK